MFRWLTRLLTGRAGTETEIRDIKSRINNEMQRCKDESLSGSAEADSKLKAFENTLDEQSVRLVGGSIVSPKRNDAQKCILAAFLLALALGGGCGTTPTENQKQLNDMNVQAGDTLSTHSDPTVAATGKDVSANSTVLAKTLIGAPEKRILYTPEFAAKLRADTLKEFEANQPWYKKFAGTLLSVGGILLGVVGFAARFYPPAAVVAGILSPVLGSVAQLKQKTEAEPDDKLHLDELQVFITGLTKIPKIGPLIATKLKDLHLDQILHSPEAPDPQPTVPTT